MALKWVYGYCINVKSFATMFVESEEGIAGETYQIYRLEKRMFPEAEEQGLKKKRPFGPERATSQYATHPEFAQNRTSSVC